MNQTKHLPPPYPTQALVRIFWVLALAMPCAAVIAGTSNPWERKSHVSDTVVDNQNGTYTYTYTVHNDSDQNPNGTDELEPFVVDWELPYFDDAGFDINDVFSPTGWLAVIETVGTANPDTGWGGTASWQDPNDPFYFGDDSPFTTATQVLHWYSDCWVNGFQPVGVGVSPQAGTECESALQDAIAPLDSLGGFGYTAAFDKTNAPYQASWANLPVRSGDPAFPLGGLPASPNATAQTPAPGTLALALVGAAGVFAARRRRVLATRA